jgi:RNA polymerase sigma factor (TIGR02999 family)
MAQSVAIGDHDFIERCSRKGERARIRFDKIAIIRAFRRRARMIRQPMNTTSPDDLTELLAECSNGNREAFDKLMPVVYEELRRLAHQYMRRERAGQTMQTTALVNEAYLRLIDYKRMRWQGRAHFFAVAAQAMRRILVEQARKHHAAKRGGDAQKVTFDETAVISRDRIEEVIAVDAALSKLEALDERKGRIVELRFFSGLNVEETAEVLGISAPTVKREWRAAKAWLHKAVMSNE